jgi:general stress protein 26
MTMADKDYDSEQFAELIGQFEHAMLVTVAEDNSLHARPMAIAEIDGPRLLFATSIESGKVSEAGQRPQAAVVMQGDGVYLAISGTAFLVTERERIARCWRPSWKIWFPDGPEDRRLVMIGIEAECAEYWDRTGLRRLKFLWEAGKALATGRRAEDERLSGHKRFALK